MRAATGRPAGAAAFGPRAGSAVAGGWGSGDGGEADAATEGRTRGRRKAPPPARCRCSSPPAGLPRPCRRSALRGGAGPLRSEAQPAAGPGSPGRAQALPRAAAGPCPVLSARSGPAVAALEWSAHRVRSAREGRPRASGPARSWGRAAPDARAFPRPCRGRMPPVRAGPSAKTVARAGGSGTGRARAGAPMRPVRGTAPPARGRSLRDPCGTCAEAPTPRPVAAAAKRPRRRTRRPGHSVACPRVPSRGTGTVSRQPTARAVCPEAGPTDPLRRPRRPRSCAARTRRRAGELPAAALCGRVAAVGIAAGAQGYPRRQPHRRPRHPARTHRGGPPRRRPPRRRSDRRADGPASDGRVRPEPRCASGRAGPSSSARGPVDP